MHPHVPYSTLVFESLKAGQTLVSTRAHPCSKESNLSEYFLRSFWRPQNNVELHPLRSLGTATPSVIHCWHLIPCPKATQEFLYKLDTNYSNCGFEECRHWRMRTRTVPSSQWNTHLLNTFIRNSLISDMYL